MITSTCLRFEIGIFPNDAICEVMNWERFFPTFQVKTEGECDGNQVWLQFRRMEKPAGGSGSFKTMKAVLPHATGSSSIGTWTA